MLDALRAESYTVEGIADHLQIGEAGPCDAQLLTFAIEQPYAQFELERLHLMAHRALRHGKFVRRPGEALVARCRLEGFEGVQ